MTTSIQCRHGLTGASKNQCKNKTSDPSGLCHKHTNAVQKSASSNSWNPAPVLPNQPEKFRLVVEYAPAKSKSESILSVMNPFSSNRKKLKNTAKSILQEDVSDRQRKRDTDSAWENKLYESIKGYTPDQHTKPPAQYLIMESLSLADSRTLELIDREFGGGKSKGAMKYLAPYANSSDTTRREALFFRDALKDTRHGERLLDDVRVSHSDFMVKDLSELTGEKLERATALLSLARTVYADLGPVPVHIGAPIPIAKGRPTAEAFRMSDALVGVVFEHTDRVDDIAEYIKARSSAPWNISPDGLRDYLTTSSRSLSSGVL